MSSSDEEFESADESCEDYKTVNKNVTTELKKKNEDKNKVIVSKTKTDEKPHKTKEEFIDGNETKMECDNLNNDSDIPKKIEATEDGWDDFDEWPEEEDNKVEITKPVVEKTKKEPTKIFSASKKEENTEKDDGWDVDDWGDIDDDEASTVTQPPRQESTKQQEHPIAAQHLENSVNVSSVLDKLADKENDGKNQSSWSGWKPWGGVVSLLSTATEGVAHLTTNVSKGISNVIESGMGIPDPEELAKMQADELKKSRDDQNDSHATTPSSVTSQLSSRKDESFLSLGQNFVSGVTQISNRVISGGLDTLEGIGKKTMNMLQENDPLLINKRKMLGIETDRPVLSQVLREAKEKTEEAERNLKHMQKHLYKKQIHFETLFDDYHGLVHLEALEMLSKQSALKLQSLMAPLSGKALQDLQETLGEVNELCELSEAEDDADGLHSVVEFSDKLNTAVEDLDVPVDFTELLKCWETNIEWLNESNTKSDQEIHDKALHCLAQTTALAVNKMHKLAEILLVLDHHSTANEADSLVQLTTILCWHIGGISARFSNKLSENGTNEDTNNLITSIFLEGSNSTSYIQKTFQLFIPILQIGAA